LLVDDENEILFGVMPENRKINELKQELRYTSVETLLNRDE